VNRACHSVLSKKSFVVRAYIEKFCIDLDVRAARLTQPNGVCKPSTFDSKRHASRPMNSGDLQIHPRAACSLPQPCPSISCGRPALEPSCVLCRLRLVCKHLLESSASMMSSFLCAESIQCRLSVHYQPKPQPCVSKHPSMQQHHHHHHQPCLQHLQPPASTPQWPKKAHPPKTVDRV
jgi:hypothetical protein